MRPPNRSEVRAFAARTAEYLDPKKLAVYTTAASLAIGAVTDVFPSRALAAQFGGNVPSQLARPASVMDVPSQYNLRALYPGPASHQFYLQGVNKVGNQASDLWYEVLPDGTIYMHSTSPGDLCHYDKYQWGSDGLEYSVTHDGCGKTTTEWDYSPAILLMPPKWSPTDGSTSTSGKSETTVLKNGNEVCTGENDWTMTVKGPEVLASGIVALHVQVIEIQTYQSITGVGFNCVKKQKKPETDEENFYVVENGIPVDGSVGQVLAYSGGLDWSIGGPVDSSGVLHPKWDVRMDHWQPLPDSSSTVTVPGADTPSPVRIPAP